MGETLKKFHRLMNAAGDAMDETSHWDALQESITSLEAEVAELQAFDAEVDEMVEVCPECGSWDTEEIHYADDFGSRKCSNCGFRGGPGEDFETYYMVNARSRRVGKELTAKDATIERLTKERDRLVADGLEALSEEDMRRMFGDENVDADAKIGAFVARHAIAKAKDKATIEKLRGLLREAIRGNYYPDDFNERVNKALKGGE